jgi:hypothetical protein
MKWVTLVGAGFLAAFVGGAAAKDFQPGDLRVCNADRCVPITDPAVVRLLGPFYYGARSPKTVAAPRFGAPAFELRFPNGYATGVAASPRLDRFLSFGVNLGHFRKGVWYAIPPRLAAELRTLTAGMEPLRVTRGMLRRSH